MLNLTDLSGPVLLFGGPYSNIQATRAMRSEAMGLGIPPHNIICTGDLVAYCGDPEETVNFIRDWGIHVVMGNCEESIGNQLEDCGCGFDKDSVCSTLSAEWFEFASARISAINRRWMKQLPKKICFQFATRQFVVLHGGVANISEFIFSSSDPDKKLRDIKSVDADCIIGGHCGIPFGHSVHEKFWLNSGVIGMPANDGTRDGWYMLLEPMGQEIMVSWHNLSFDADATASSMQNAGLGRSYHDALLTGIWPSMDILPREEMSQQGKQIALPSISIQTIA